MAQKDILYNTTVSPGYSNDLSLSAEELNEFRTAIFQQYMDVIHEKYPQYADSFSNKGIAHYHELSYLIDHELCWNKSNRCLSEEFVEKFKKMRIYETLVNIYGRFKISDVIYDQTHVKGKEEIYWRIVRPNMPSDIGPLHADKWFHEILGMKDSALHESSHTIKIWIPIYCEAGKNGLLIMPNSNQRDWKHSMQLVNGIPKPVFLDEANPELIITEPGNMLIFDEKTLHGGALNGGSTTRVSCEITMVFDKKL